MSRQNCVYCGKEITTRSSEHVIQNALGGLYESEDICCPECNNYISRCIDAPFTKIFNPIIGKIDNFSKTNNTKSMPSCTGKVLYNNKIYNAFIKNGKVVGCPDLSRELKTDISKLPLQIVAYDFKLDNEIFHTGMAKIAFNYALDKGIDLDTLKHGLNIEKTANDIQKISFTYPMIPFYPLNPVDKYIELDTDFKLYHNMILFSQESTLWCYIDLFNTFQYYVLLSDNLPQGINVYDNYAQTLQKIDRTDPELDIYRPKDILIYAQQYGVEPCLDKEEFSRRIKNAIAKKSQKKALESIVSDKMAAMPIDYSLQIAQDPGKLLPFAHSMRLYFDDNDKLRTGNFRTITTDTNGYIASYPYAINTVLRQDQTPLRSYTMSKFNRLTNFLNQKTK